MTPEELAKRLKEIAERGVMRRVATVVRSAIDADARTVELAFSSETEAVERWFGIEVLGHGAGEVDLSRLGNGAPVLWMHDWRDQRGVVESARIDSDGVGRAVVRFSRSEAGNQLFQDIVDGIISKVSVGYTVEGLKLEEERDGVDVYRITAWTPYEISMVSVPADDSVGVGRSLEIPQEETGTETGEVEATNSNLLPETRTAKTMEKILRDETGNLVRALVDDSGAITKVLEVIERAGEAQVAAQARGRNDEQARVRAITELGTQYGKTERALEFIGSGKSPEDFQRELLADFAKERAGSKPLGEQGVAANIGMDDKDVRNYSVMRAIRALANPNDKAAQEAAAFEIECSAEAQRAYGKDAQGILIPADVLNSARAFNAGGAANSPTGAQSGANLVDTSLLTGSFIDMLRNRTTIMQLGTPMGGLVGNVEIPKQTGGATAYWVGEGVDATEGTPVIGQLALNPKSVAAYTDITRRLAMQSTPDAEALVVRDLNLAMAQAIDKAGYYGSGTSGQPLGIANYSGINGSVFASAGAPTFAELVKMETEIALDNADVNSMAYVGNAGFRGHAKTTPKFGTGTEATIWEAGNTVNGYRTEITNQVNTGDVFFGNFADLIIALWGGLDLVVDPYSLSKSGGLRVVVFQDVDFVARRVESFCLGRAA